MKAKTCESCGMPMKQMDDFGGGNPDSAYCRYCTYDDGTLKPYEVKVEELAQFIAQRSGATPEAARTTARANLAKMPAWKDIAV